MLFAPAGSGGRLRRPVDGLLLAVAAVLFVLASVAADATTTAVQRRQVAASADLLGWFDAGWRTAYGVLLGYAVLVAVATLATRRWALARDLLLAGAAMVAGGVLAGRLVDGDWPRLAEGLWSANGQYPALRFAVAVTILAAAGPELTRPARLVTITSVVLAGTGAVVLGLAYPAGVLGGAALGLAAAAAVRLTFGTTAGFPAPARVLAGLQELGILAGELRVARQQRPGAASYVGVDRDGAALHIVVLARDAQDTQRLANTWRNLAYREDAPDLATGRLHQIEHEGLITLLAARAGVLAATPVAAGLVASGDAFLVTAQPAARTAEEAGDAVTDDVLADLWAAAARLRAERLSHGALNLASVLITDSGPMLVGFQRGRLAASPSALNTDFAELLVATSLVAGPDRAVRAAVAAVGHDVVEEALPLLQRAALTPHLRRLARHRELDLDGLRRKAADAAGTEVPEITELRRVRLRDLLTMAMLVLAAYLIVGQLADIGFGTVYDELRQAEWSWVVLGVLLAQLTFVADAVSLRGAVLAPLPLRPCVALESAIKFINLTVPSAAGSVALTIRFLQRQGVPTGPAVASGAVDTVSEIMVQVALLALLLPFVDIDTDLSAIQRNSSDPPWLLLGLALVVVVAAVVLAVPRWRAKVLPGVSSAWTSLVAVGKTRSKRVQLFAGNLATPLLYSLTLGAACHAYGVELSLAQLVTVNIAASVLASVVPVPGGVGVAEATLAAGLSAVGVPQSAAFAIALTHRLCTYYTPPVWGYLSLRWLTRDGYL